MNNTRILLLGSSGFLGGNICQHLNSAYEITNVSRTKSANGRGYLNLTFHEYLKSDLRYDVVINCLNSYNITDIDELNYVNVTLPKQIIKHASRHTSPLIVQFDTFFRKNTKKYPYMENYIKSKKIINEDLHANYPNTCITLALEQLYGPNDRNGKFVFWVLEALKKNQNIILRNPNFIRDFIFVDDVVNLIKNLIVHYATEHRVLLADAEVGTGDGVTVREFVEKLKSALQSTSKIIESKMQNADEKNELECSIAKISPVLKEYWKPLYDLDSGITEMLKYEK